MKIRLFVDDCDLFLRLCNRCRSRLGVFVFDLLVIAESNKVCRNYLVELLFDYDKFCDGFITLFGRHECENNYQSQLRLLRHSGSKSVANYFARVTDICSRAYPSYSTKVQLDLAVENVISGFVDMSSREYLQRERARRLVD